MPILLGPLAIIELVTVVHEWTTTFLVPSLLLLSTGQLIKVESTPKPLRVLSERCVKTSENGSPIPRIGPGSTLTRPESVTIPLVICCVSEINPVLTYTVP